jgi:rhodanese-related sulfurtransferase
LSAQELPIEVTVQQAEELRKQGAVILDVREDWEFEQGHIDGALHIPLQTLPARLDDVPKDQRVVINCHHGGRSMRAVQFLREQGHNHIANLQGGLDRWSQEIDPSIARY